MPDKRKKAGIAESFWGFHKLSVDSYVRRLMEGLGLPSGKRKRALDLGCGVGDEALYLAGLGYRVEALDLEAKEQWAQVARESRGQVRFEVGDAQALGRRSSSYDLVFEKDMLHHATDPVRALKEMERLTKPGGKLILIEANRMNPIFYIHLTLMGNHQHFTRRRLAELLEEAGLQGAVVRRREARCWPVNRKWAQAFFNGLQNVVEAIPFLRPFLCYHMVLWDKPLARRIREAH